MGVKQRILRRQVVQNLDRGWPIPEDCVEVVAVRPMAHLVEGARAVERDEVIAIFEEDAAPAGNGGQSTKGAAGANAQDEAAVAGTASPDAASVSLVEEGEID